MDFLDTIQLILMYFYASAIHVSFVIVTKKCFLDKYSFKNIAIPMLLSPSVATNAIFWFIDEIYWGFTPEETIIGHMIYIGVLFAVVAVQLPFYIKFVKPQTKSFAVFIYLCCLVFSLYNNIVENTVVASSFIAGNIWFRNLFMIVAALVFYRIVIVPFSEVSRTKQERRMTAFILIPAVAIIIKLVFLVLHDAADDYYMSGFFIRSDELLEDVHDVIVQYMGEFNNEWIFYREIYSVALYTILAMLIIAFAMIVRNIIQLNEINRQNIEIKLAHDNIKTLSVEVMEALARTIDAKDKYTNGHSSRVAKYSRMIAERMGMDAEFCENIYYMGLLHDIGKIGVPNEIINKPDRLTDTEYEVIKSHPGIGFSILKEIKSRSDLAFGALWHHERYDGKGYPEYKAGEDIPIEARIIAIADSYDAMTSNRSYRKYLPQDKVRAEIERCAGTQFDPNVAKCMLTIIDEDKDYILHE